MSLLKIDHSHPFTICKFWYLPQPGGVISLKNRPRNIWVNYNNSLTWIKAIWGWFPLLTMIPVRENSEVVIIYPETSVDEPMGWTPSPLRPRPGLGELLFAVQLLDGRLKSREEFLHHLGDGKRVTEWSPCQERYAKYIDIWDWLGFKMI